MESIMRTITILLATVLIAAPALAFQPDVNDELQLDVAKSICTGRGNIFLQSVWVAL